MKLLFIFGSLAVGKMTVGQELMKITDLRLFHNHMSIDIVNEIFGKSTGNNWDTIYKLRELVFEEFAKSDNYGLIFTYSMPGFDNQSELDYVSRVCDIFKQANADTEIYYAKLVAPQQIRLQRNITENRLQHKPSKRDVEWSNQDLIDWDITYPNNGEVPFENYIEIENSNIPPDIAAKMIKEKFSL